MDLFGMFKNKVLLVNKEDAEKMNLKDGDKLVVQIANKYLENKGPYILPENYLEPLDLPKAPKPEMPERGEDFLLPIGLRPFAGSHV